MQLIFLAMAILLVPLVHGYAANRTAPSLGACKEEVISSIKTLWKTNGKPKNILQYIEKNGLLKLTHTSYDYYNSENKCVYAKLANGVLSATFIPKNGGTPANLSYTVVENEDGVIKAKLAQNDAPEFRWNWYPIYADNGVVVSYACGDVEGSSGSSPLVSGSSGSSPLVSGSSGSSPLVSGAREPPVISILVANNNKSPLTRTAINDFRGLVNGWGLKFKYNYGSECDVSE